MFYKKLHVQANGLFKKKRFILYSLLTLTVILIFLKYSIETGTDLNSSQQTKCLFCNIANGTVSATKLEFENDEFVIFKDIRPASKHHYLAIPKDHYESLKVLNKSHVGLIKRMQDGMLQFLASKGVNLNDTILGYHMPPFISQKHLHLHGISPPSEMGLSDRISFFLPSFWFKSADDAVAYLKRPEL